MNVKTNWLIGIMEADRLVAVRIEYPNGNIRYGLMNGGDEITWNLTEVEYWSIAHEIGQQYDSVLYHGVKLSSCSPRWPKGDLPF